MPPELHRLLCRQIKRHLGGDGAPPPELQSFLDAVSDAYRHFDEDRAILERSMELSSQELMQANTDLRAVVSTFPDLFFWLTTDGIVLGCHASSMQDMFLPASDIIGRDITRGPDVVVGSHFRSALEEIQAGSPLVTREYSMDLKGSRQHYEARLVPLGSGRVLAIVRNITSRHELEAKLLHTQKLEAIGQLAAGIAHEINTPTQYVGDNTRFLQTAFTDMIDLLDNFIVLLDAARRGEVTPGLVESVGAAMDNCDLEFLRTEVPAATDQTLEGVQRVTKIVRAMKDFSHPDSAEKSLVDLNKAIESTLTVARNEWKYVAEMVTDFDPELPPVPCLVGEFNQVILNMVINAAHAIKDVIGESGSAKGTITVRTRASGDWVEVRIQDTGTGIPEAIRGRIFDPFFTTKTVGKGTGQGLAISRQVIVNKHGGTVDVETEVGRGTTFILRLPLGEAADGEKKAA